MTPKNKPFLFMRHGETDWNKKGLFQGQNDILLNDVGIQQIHDSARQNTAHLNDIDHIFYSPLTRTVQTKDIIARFIPTIKTTPVKEIMPCNSIETSKFILKSKGVSDLPSFKKIEDNGERIESFLKRIQTGLDFILSHNSKAPLIVSHGEVHSGVCMVLGITPYASPNGSITVFENTGDWRARKP